MFQNMQDDVPIEVVKVQVAPAFRGFVHQFPKYSLSSIEGGKGHQNYMPISKNNYI